MENKKSALTSQVKQNSGGKKMFSHAVGLWLHYMGLLLVLSRSAQRLYTPDPSVLQKTELPHVQQWTVPVVLASRASLWA